MAFVVEDGTGVAGANAYVPLTTALLYHQDRGNSVWWSKTAGEQQEAIVRATQAIDALGYGRFFGTRASTTQGLQWPRTDAYDPDGELLDGVPLPLVYAVCEAALAEIQEPYALQPTTGPKVTEERVEGVASVKYLYGAYQGTTYRAHTRWLRRVMRGAAQILVDRV